MPVLECADLNIANKIAKAQQQFLRFEGGFVLAANLDALLIKHELLNACATAHHHVARLLRKLSIEWWRAVKEGFCRHANKR